MPPSAVARWARANRKFDSGPEVRLRSILHQRGQRFRKYPVVQLNRIRVRPDIVFVRPKLAVFVDGCFWHSCPEHGRAPRTNIEYWAPKLQRNIERDRLVTTELESAGWMVLRLWEHNAAEVAADSVMLALAARQGPHVQRPNASSNNPPCDR